MVDVKFGGLWGGCCSNDIWDGFMEEYSEGLRKFCSHTRLRWEKAPRLDFGMIFGVGIWSLRKFFSVLFSIDCAKDVSDAAQVEGAI